MRRISACKVLKLRFRSLLNGFGCHASLIISFELVCCSKNGEKHRIRLCNAAGFNTIVDELSHIRPIVSENNSIRCVIVLILNLIVVNLWSNVWLQFCVASDIYFWCLVTSIFRLAYILFIRCFVVCCVKS